MRGVVPLDSTRHTDERNLMPRRFLKDLDEREKIHQVFILGDKQLRHNKNGNLYLQMRLSDRSGSCNAMMWNVSEHDAREVRNGDYVMIQGMSQFYNSALQVIVESIEIANPGDINEEDFIHIDKERGKQLIDELTENLMAMENEHLRALAENFLQDEAFMKKFSVAPAAMKHHHAFHGGLLTHVNQLVRLAKTVACEYDELNADLLIMGAFLHDVGKIDELTYERNLGYSDEGQLVGHLVMGVGVLDRQIEKLDATRDTPFPHSLAIHLRHMIVSHHGRYEFGSPKLPMSLEAIALHLLDDLDAKIHNFSLLMQADANSGTPWTPYHANLGRKLYKGDPAS